MFCLELRGDFGLELRGDICLELRGDFCLELMGDFCLGLRGDFCLELRGDLSARGLVAREDSLEALDGLSFQLPAQERAAPVAANIHRYKAQRLLYHSAEGSRTC